MKAQSGFLEKRLQQAVQGDHDEADKMDYEFMATLVSKMIPAFEAMSNTDTKEIKMNE